MLKFDALRTGCYDRTAGWSSQVARWAHNPKVGGSNPPPATNFIALGIPGDPSQGGPHGRPFHSARTTASSPPRATMPQGRSENREVERVGAALRADIAVHD